MDIVLQFVSIMLYQWGLDIALRPWFMDLFSAFTWWFISLRIVATISYGP